MSKKKKREFQMRIPIPAKGGIKAQSYRTRHSRKWWTRKWLEMMEGLHIGARLGRGRGYAFSGQVTELTVAPGLITATVQGGKSEPYICEIREEAVPHESALRIKKALLAKPMLLAQLLVRNLPPEADTIFTAAGYPLIPNEIFPLKSHCSCPDYANPCKHIAAVYYLIAEAIEHNPLLLLEFRGITRAFLTECAPGDSEAEPDILTGIEEKPEATFWDAELPLPFSFGHYPQPKCPAPFVRRLGSIPFWRGEEKFIEAISRCGEKTMLWGK